MSFENLRLKRGSKAANNNYTGRQGELTLDSDNYVLRVHDGSTPGGISVAKANYIRSSERIIGSKVATQGNDTFEIPYVELTEHGVVKEHSTHTHTLKAFEHAVNGLVPNPNMNTVNDHAAAGKYFLCNDGKWYNIMNTVHEYYASKDNGTFSGDVSAQSLNTTSDIREKENIESVEEYDLSNIKTYRYNFIKDSNKTPKIGLIAQEVQNIIPEAVKSDENGILSLDYCAIVAALLSKVNSLESQIKELKEQMKGE